MLLKNKTAIIYGGGGAIGGAVASAFAHEGARVFLAGRKAEALVNVARKIRDNGGQAAIATVDTLDKEAVDRHADSVIEQTGSIDISFNAVGVFHVQGVPLVDLSLEEYNLPITTYNTSNFLTATAAGRQMIKQGSGVIFTITTPGGLMPHGVTSGFGVSNAAVEALTRQLACELGPHGIRVICLRSDGIPEIALTDSHSRQVFEKRSASMGMTLDELYTTMTKGTLLQRSPTLADVAETAAYLASDKARAITATVANLTSGAIVG